MSASLEQPAIFTTQRTAWYVAALLFVVLGGFFCVQMNHEWHALHAQWQTQQGQRSQAWQQQRRANERAQQVVANAYFSVRNSGREATAADAARLLNDGKPLQIENGSCYYRDAQTGGTTLLMFDSKHWLGVWYVKPDSPPHGKWPGHTGYKIADSLRRTACGLAYIAAGIMLLALLFNWRSRSREARLCGSVDLLFMSALALTLAMLSPYSNRLWTFFFLDPGGWGVIGIAIAILLIVVATCLPERGSGASCRSCRYDLTGNISGVCPECGTPIRAVAVGDTQVAGSAV